MLHAQFGRPAVGAALFIVCGHDVLIGRRLGAHGANTYSIPGGHVDWGETAQHAATREACEETGLAFYDTEVREVGFTDDFMPDENKHYLTLFFATNCQEYPVPRLLEPEKYTDHQWVPMTMLRSRPLFLPLANYLDKYGFVRLLPQ